jgi:hypothetical protein
MNEIITMDNESLKATLADLERKIDGIIRAPAHVINFQPSELMLIDRYNLVHAELDQRWSDDS